MDESSIRKINLIDVLSEKYIDLPEISEECMNAWSTEQITYYYESGGTSKPSSLNGMASQGPSEKGKELDQLRKFNIKVSSCIISSP